MSNVASISAKDFKVKRQSSALNIIDVRETYEFAIDHIEGAINLPLSSFDINKLTKMDEYYLICESGARSEQVIPILAKMGYKVINVDGGMFMYRRQKQ